MRIPKLWMRLYFHEMFLTQGIMYINSVGCTSCKFQEVFMTSARQRSAALLMLNAALHFQS